MKNGLKLWIIVFIILAIAGGTSFKWAKKINLHSDTDVEGAYNDLVNETKSSGVYGEVAGDFADFKGKLKSLASAIAKQDKTTDNDSAVAKTVSDALTKTAEDIADGTVENKTNELYSDVKETVFSGSANILEILGKVGLLEPKESQNESVYLATAYVKKVIDGDTIWAIVNNEEQKIRFIGIDTPESVHMDESRNTEYGTMASDYTKSVLKEGQTIYLEFDKEDTDAYGRTLAYIWLSDNTQDIGNMLNAIIVANGYAVNMEIEPNTKYASEFKALRENAENYKIGLWQYEGFIALWE